MGNWKVINPSGKYVASCLHAEDAACLVALYGDGAQINYAHRTIVWREGKESQPAGESYDHVARICFDRFEAYWERKHNEALRRSAAVLAKDIR